MFVFIKKVFCMGSLFLSNLVGTNSLNCISMKNEECKQDQKLVILMVIILYFILFNIKINKCSGNCNNINNPYAKMCVLDIAKNLNVKVFNLMSRTHETRFLEWHEKCKCECRLSAIVCNNKQQ